jgi:hypothetical protein
MLKDFVEQLAGIDGDKSSAKSTEGRPCDDDDHDRDVHDKVDDDVVIIVCCVGAVLLMMTRTVQ